MIVAKLGGSTLGQPELRQWIDALAGSSLPLVIVPGGGPFADRIRVAQGEHRFSDKAAHAMAILAMEQFGHLLLDSDSRLFGARSLPEMQAAAANQRSSVWLPSALALATPEIEASWDITSDSLAAWLAGQLQATALVLIKQSGEVSAVNTVETLATRGIIDPAFANMLPAVIDLYVAGPRDVETVAAELASGNLPGTRIGRAAASLRKVG